MSLVLLLLVLIGGVVALPFVLLARRRTSSQGTSPAEIVTYLILAVATLITTNSISSLLEIVMPGDGVLIAGADDLALSLSTLIVAGVVAVALWIAMERTTTDLARPARELYLAVVNRGVDDGVGGRCRPGAPVGSWGRRLRAVRIGRHRRLRSEPGSSMSGCDVRPRNLTSFVRWPGLCSG